ncbi:MAG: GNAT family N-acetyltransferase [Treponema sp.]|nr:GNAT family N-acetyltransferase [Treponema sp.]
MTGLMTERFMDLLARDFNCNPDDFARPENIITLPEIRAGRRAYSDEKYFFRMITTGGNAVITADERLHDFLRPYISARTGHWLFEFPNLLPIERELENHGYTLTQTYHMFIPCADTEPERDFPVRWFYDDEIGRFYGDGRFPNAICGEPDPARADRIAVCAYDGETIMGMAGCSEAAPGFHQIGIDVIPQYRSKGVGCALVTLLKNKITERGDIPFYGTSLSNYHSWHIALKSGFCPAWVEVAARKSEEIAS